MSRRAWPGESVQFRLGLCRLGDLVGLGWVSPELQVSLV